MSTLPKRLLLSLLCFALPVAMAQTTPPSRDWHAAIARGVELFKSGHYADAEAAFEQAASLRPEDPVSHLYTGLAWQQQFIPGVAPGAPDMSGIRLRAEQEFRRALDLDAQNWPALVLLGQLMLDESRFDEAGTLYKKALDPDSTNPDIWCTLGAIAGKQAWPAVRDAQLRAMRETRRMPDAAAMAQLNVSLSPVVERGFADLHHALSLAPQHLRAMDWLGTLLRLRALLTNNPADLAQAGEWQRKAQEVQEEQNRLGTAGVIFVWPATFAGTWPVLRDFASHAVRPMPPPPPPPTRSEPHGPGAAGHGPGWLGIPACSR
jgi:tetratricopeptide (TPR) repeat protein